MYYNSERICKPSPSYDWGCSRRALGTAIVEGVLMTRWGASRGKEYQGCGCRCAVREKQLKKRMKGTESRPQVATRVAPI